MCFCFFPISMADSSPLILHNISDFSEHSVWSYKLFIKSGVSACWGCSMEMSFYFRLLSSSFCEGVKSVFSQVLVDVQQLLFYLLPSDSAGGKKRENVLPYSFVIKDKLTFSHTFHFLIFFFFFSAKGLEKRRSCPAAHCMFWKSKPIRVCLGHMSNPVEKPDCSTMALCPA